MIDKLPHKDVHEYSRRAQNPRLWVFAKLIGEAEERVVVSIFLVVMKMKEICLYKDKDSPLKYEQSVDGFF